MRARVRSLGAVLLALWISTLGPWLVSSRGAEAADAPTQYQLETDLTCQCGCGLTVHSCNHLNCGSGIPLKQEISEQIAAGKTRTDILSHFEQKYGEKILSSPTTRGFNIAAWTVPFIAIALGGLLVAVVLSRWRRATTERASAPIGVAPRPVDSAQRERLDDELRDFDRRS